MATKIIKFLYREYILVNNLLILTLLYSVKNCVCSFVNNNRTKKLQTKTVHLKEQFKAK